MTTEKKLILPKMGLAAVVSLVTNNIIRFFKEMQLHPCSGAFQNVAKVANLQQVHFSLKTLFKRLATFNPVRHFEMHPPCS